MITYGCLSLKGQIDKTTAGSFMADKVKRKKRLSSFQIIILGFIGVIILGALILMLPISSQKGVFTPFNQSLFTATSAVCVTGLVVQDTATYWSIFGQAVILIMIQIGGLGVVTMAISFVRLSGRKISLSRRSTMQSSISAPNVGGILQLTNFVLKGTAIIAGVVALLPVFIKDHGLKGIWMAVFHSVSAFCNAGFDILGQPDNRFQSMTSYESSAYVNIVLMLLIVIGGIGFITWKDFTTHRFRFKRYRMQSKVILLTSAALIVIPAIVFFILDFAGLPLGERILSSVFQSVTTRTAGFNTADLTGMTRIGHAIMIFLMLVGGSPGSTAGGMKTTTIAVLIANAISTFRQKEDPEVFGRRIGAGVVKTASTILMMYVALCFSAAAVISAVENLPLGICLFETASAVGTVGLTLGITPSLGVLSQCILIVLMFLGRVGGLTVIFAALSGANKKLSKLPQEYITVG